MRIEDIAEALHERLDGGSDINYKFVIEYADVINRITSMVLGILSVFIYVVTPFIVVSEVAYIIFPSIREVGDMAIEKLKTRGVSNRLLGFAFKDAKRAIREVYCKSGEGGTAAILKKYLWLRCTSMIGIAFILMFVLQGGNQIINTVWSLVGNIIKAAFY